MTRQAPAIAAAAPPGRVQFALFLQWIADRQLAAAATAAGGMAIGLYRDLAVGAAPDGAEAWAAGPALLHGVSVGAPPDPLGPQGQVWGLPPPDPRAAARDRLRGVRRPAARQHAPRRRAAHRPRDGAGPAVPGAGRRARAGRHLSRLSAARPARGAGAGKRAGAAAWWWARTSAPCRTASAPRWPSTTCCPTRCCASRATATGRVRRRTTRSARSPAPPPTTSATLAGWWQGSDIDERAALGLLEGPAEAAERQARAAEKAELLALLQAEGLAGDDLVAAVHALLARTPCRLVLWQADDLAGEVVGVNLPGTDRERPNWRRRLRVTVEGLLKEGQGSALDPPRAERPLEPTT